jgi:hypothetical protein
VQVDLVTQYSSPKGAIGQPGSNIVLSKYQTFPAKKATSWHSMNVSGVAYGVLLNGHMTGVLTSALGSNGSVLTNATTSSNFTMIYRWQGVYMPVQVRITMDIFSELFVILVVNPTCLCKVIWSTSTIIYWKPFIENKIMVFNHLQEDYGGVVSILMFHWHFSKKTEFG